MAGFREDVKNEEEQGLGGGAGGGSTWLHLIGSARILNFTASSLALNWF